MKILEKLLEDTRNEAMEESQRKRELREENLRFMQYCKTNRQEQADREKQVERLVNDEVEKQWARKMEQYRLEREARKRLMDNVLKTREEQIEERSKLKCRPTAHFPLNRLTLGLLKYKYYPNIKEFCMRKFAKISLCLQLTDSEIVILFFILIKVIKN